MIVPLNVPSLASHAPLHVSTRAYRRGRTRTNTERHKAKGGESIAKDINKRIAAEISWSRTDDRSGRTRPAREAFLKKFEKEVDPDGKLPPYERRLRAEHAKRAYMLQLAKKSAAARRVN